MGKTAGEDLAREFKFTVRHVKFEMCPYNVLIWRFQIKNWVYKSEFRGTVYRGDIMSDTT